MNGLLPAALMGGKPTYEQLVVLLDACIPLLEAAAKREARKPALSYGMTQITWQKRLEAARKYIAASGVDL
jgi:hypothetical protein